MRLALAPAAAVEATFVVAEEALANAELHLSCLGQPQCTFERARIAAAVVYFWDETRIQRHCRVPAAWRLLYKRGEEWKPVENPSPCAAEPDRFNRVTFTPVETPALRIEAQPAPEWSGGILQWRVEEAKA